MPKFNCSLCGKPVDGRKLFSPQKLENRILELIKQERPEWEATRGICSDCHEQFRAKKFLSYMEQEYLKISEMERSLIKKVVGGKRVSRMVHQEFDETLTFGQRLADRVAQFGGSWTFIIAFGGILFAWTGVNTLILVTRAWDPYPYILLNLMLSTLAALQGPVIMMSQNRQAEKDRFQAKQDYEVNLMAEIEIRDLHDKLDALRFKQWHELWHIQQRQLELLEHLHKELSHPEVKTVEPAPYRPPEV